MSAERARKVVFVSANLKLQAGDYPKRPYIYCDPESVV